MFKFENTQEFVDIIKASLEQRRVSDSVDIVEDKGQEHSLTPSQSSKFVEIGCGSGALSLALLHECQWVHIAFIVCLNFCVFDHFLFEHYIILKCFFSFLSFLFFKL